MHLEGIKYTITQGMLPDSSQKLLLLTIGHMEYISQPPYVGPIVRSCQWNLSGCDVYHLKAEGV